MANILTTIIVLLFTIFCQAQKKPAYIPPSIDDEEIPVVKTELPVPEDGKDYVVQYFKGITDGVESRIAVKKLGYIIRPAMVQVISEDGRELAIELVKKNWDDVLRSGTTKNGTYESSFKTALEFGIKISAKEVGIPFIVAVSAGVELFPASNLFVDASTMRAGNASNGAEKSNEIGGGSESSNTILYIIIAIALIGIFTLLAILVFRKKGKGSATILLLMITLPLNANLVTAVGGSAVGQMAGGIGKALAEHYGKGGFNGDVPLGEDDKDYEPTPDPRGQPSLPSSCYEVARMGNSGSSGSSNPDISGAKNPLNSGGDSITRVGDVAGAISGSETGEDIDQEEEKDKDFAKEREKIQSDFAHYRELALYHQNQGKSEAQENFNRTSREASKQLDKDLREANGNAELMAQATTNHATRLAQLSVELATANSQFEIDYALDMANLAGDELDALVALAEEEAAYQAQQNGGGVEKDPSSRIPKKDPARQQDKGDGGKSGSSPEDPKDASGIPPTSGPGARDREKEAGCKCLERAYADLQKQRYRLEKLLKIGQHTKKVTDFGISFGDDFAGIHAVSGLAWQKERAKVLKAIDQFDVTYDNKYKEIIDGLYNALIEIDECETKLGYENWYSQSGFIYYEFMKVRYASYK
jgi:hypothetical protein